MKLYFISKAPCTKLLSCQATSSETVKKEKVCFSNFIFRRLVSDPAASLT
jgi:hypothetical protein